MQRCAALGLLWVVHTAAARHDLGLRFGGGHVDRTVESEESQERFARSHRLVRVRALEPLGLDVGVLDKVRLDRALGQVDIMAVLVDDLLEAARHGHHGLSRPKALDRAGGARN
ncbi:hypothetical protein T492DRAFT_840581 [Pavlovales sp. CCMP2436]|nr:hypothetical protein T492DRAFT_840581 [Pavlovales sp. CCMP2436]